MFSFNFKTKKYTNYGDSLYVVGNYEMFGNWNPKMGLKLTTDKRSYPIWKSEILETNNQDDILNFEYKYVVITKDGDVYWEGGNNRTLVNSLKISNWEFDKELKTRTTKSISFTTNAKTNTPKIFNELIKLRNIYILIKGDMKQLKYANIIHVNYMKKQIIFKVKENFIKKNKLQHDNLPYYCMNFVNNNPVIEGPFEYYLF